MQQADQLIRTKLCPPFVRPALVPRQRLQSQVMQGLLGPLTLVIAPAGFGKTTLLSSCAASCGMPVAWLSLDKNDNQPGRFLTYLVAALQSASKLIGSEAAKLMAGLQPALPEAVLTSLINDLDVSSEEVVLVLDDFQFISSPEVHGAVTFIIDHCPRTCHLLIASRSDPPLPLARLRARGQLVELRAADLRFTDPEAGQFLNDVMGLHLDSASVSALAERTEGWAAGLQMASIALQSQLSMSDRGSVRGFIEGFSGTNRHILDYLMEEILSNQTTEIQHFLLNTSILERMTAPLCDVLLTDGRQLEKTAIDEKYRAASLPQYRSAAILKYLERENLFLVPLDHGTARGTGAAWFRYHHLFADLLQARLLEAQPDQIARLHRRAAAWFEQNNLIVEAIQHLIAAQEIGQAANLMQQYGPVFWAQNDPSIVQMAESLPREILLARTKLGLYLAWLLICQAHIKRAIPLLNELAHPLPDAESNADLRWAQTVLLCAQAFLNPPGILPGVSALDEIPADESILRDAAEVLYGMALARRGDLDGAVEMSLRCIQAATTQEQSDATWVVPSPVPFLARVYLIQGRLHAAVDLCRKYLNPTKQKAASFINSPGSMEIALGEVLYEWNSLEEAEKLIRDGLRANEPWKNIMTDGFGTIALVHLLQAKGDIFGAVKAFQDFEARLQNTAQPREFEDELRTLNVRLRLAAGDIQNASLWADDVCQSKDFQDFPERYRLTLAHIRLTQKRYAEAEEILASELSSETSINRIARQIEAHLLLAAAVAAQQRISEALDHVRSCLALAEPEGYLRVFLNVGEPARDLLATYLRSGTSDHQQYAHKVLKTFPSPRATGSQILRSETLAEPISSRELEVLQLMAQGRTNQEIARQLFVAPGTIKAHAASIYRKLDAANRTEAVARARQMGLLG